MAPYSSVTRNTTRVESAPSASNFVSSGQCLAAAQLKQTQAFVWMAFVAPLWNVRIVNLREEPHFAAMEKSTII